MPPHLAGKTLPQAVTVVEVGPRDGLQNEPKPVPTETKVRLIEALAASGLRHIEITSFVHPRLVPQLADAEELCRRLQKREGVRYTALVPNLKGLERALACGIRSIALLTAASDTFNLKNIGCSTAESLERARAVAAEAGKAGLELRGYISCAFHCPYEGRVDPAQVVPLVRAYRDMGVRSVSIGDTTGAAYPTQVGALLERLAREGLGPSGLALHLHDTYRRALANALAGLLHGVEEFDASAGGLGGCPFAPGARGNVATEDLVDFLEGMGISTGVDLERLRETAAWIRKTVGAGPSA